MPLPAWADGFNVAHNPRGEPLYPYVETLRDPGGALTIFDVTSQEARGDFLQGADSHLNFGFTDATYWIRIPVANTSDKPVTWVLDLGYPIYQFLELYYLEDGKGYQVERTGNELPFHSRDLDFVDYAFKLTEPPDSARTYYLRVHTDVSLLLPLKAWDEPSFQRHMAGKYVLLGLYFGIIMVMLVYNLFLYVSVKEGEQRDHNYLYYVIFLVGMWFTQFSHHGLGFQFLWPENIWWNTRSIMILSAFAFFWGVRFSRSFLDAARNTPVMDKVMKYMEILAAVTAVCGFFASNMVMAILMNLLLLTLFVLLAAGIHSWLKGYRSARFYIIAWGLFLVGLTVFAFMNFGIVDITPFTRLSYLFGSGLEVMLLSLALADRINLMRREKEEAQAEVLKQQKLVQETLERSKEELEKKVEERTAQLLTAKEVAENATKLKDQFVSLVSHDLRSPLGSIVSMLGMVDGTGAFELPEEKKKKTMGRVKEIALGLTDMIDQLLNISRLQTGKIKPIKRRQDLRQLVTVFTERLQYTAREKGVTLENRVKEGCSLMADRALLGEVVSNLVLNAIKFCSEGDTITLYQPEGACNTLAVKDTGVGIPPDMVGKLFNHEIKTTTEGTAGEKGTGLGLPYCHDIITAHGGTIAVTTALGEGTEFVITLPETRSIVLVADDQEIQRHILKEHVESVSSASVLEAANGMEVLEIMKDITPDLVITDLDMPGMSGNELIAKIRANPSLPGLPVIVVSSPGGDGADDENTMKARLKELGADEFFPKPLAVDSFAARLRKYVY